MNAGQMLTVFTHAIVREVSRSLAECELVHLPRQKIDLALARRQHAAYVAALESAGVRVRVLPEAPALPDATFIEDPLLVLDEFAVVCRPGAASREPESEFLAREIAANRPVFRLAAPATLEGGDVLPIGRTLFVGNSSRTNREGIAQLERIVSRLGYRVVPVAVKNCLHLKTGITAPADGLLLANPEWIEVGPFAGIEVVPVPPSEPWGANTLSVNGRVFVAATAPRTAELLAARGLEVLRIDISELQKAEAGLTCLSLLYRDGGHLG